jgi:hypothetical protein
VTAKLDRAINQSRVRKFLGETAGGCGGALNLFLVLVGDNCGLYRTGQYSFDAEKPIVRSQAPSITQKRSSSEAAEAAVHAHGTAISAKDRAMSVQREETAFMTLICHDCAAATDSHMATP